MAETKKEIKLFYCYAREDKKLRDKLEIHLSGLKRPYHLINWSDREISPGEDWEQAIDTHLNTAHLIFLLISPHFMASDYCYGKEMQRALARHEAGTCRLIPILLRPVYWEYAPFSKLQMLPTNAKAIIRWPNRDAAFEDVVKGISKAIKEVLFSLISTEEWLENDGTIRHFERNEEALATSSVHNTEQHKAKKAEDEILRVVRKLEAKGKPPTVRDLSRYLTRIDVGHIKTGITNLIHEGLLSENNSGKSPRYTTMEET